MLASRQKNKKDLYSYTHLTFMYTTWTSNHLLSVNQGAVSSGGNNCLTILTNQMLKSKLCLFSIQRTKLVDLSGFRVELFFSRLRHIFVTPCKFHIRYGLKKGILVLFFIFVGFLLIFTAPQVNEFTHLNSFRQICPKTLLLQDL